MMFEVEMGIFRYKVNLNDETCSCRSWDSMGIPCVMLYKIICYIKKYQEVSIRVLP